jgi:hypothetical protein
MATADPGLPPDWKLPRLRIDRDGAWLDDGVEVTHPGILANLRANLRRDAGGYYIQTRVRIPVEVDDVPWVVVRVEPHGDRLRATLNDGTEEEIDPAALRLRAGDVPYCPVKGGAFEARLNRAAAHQLLALAHHDERTGQGMLRVGSREVPLHRGV